MSIAAPLYHSLVTSLIQCCYLYPYLVLYCSYIAATILNQGCVRSSCDNIVCTCYVDLSTEPRYVWHMYTVDIVVGRRHRRPLILYTHHCYCWKGTSIISHRVEFSLEFLWRRKSGCNFGGVFNHIKVSMLHLLKERCSLKALKFNKF